MRPNYQRASANKRRRRRGPPVGAQAHLGHLMPTAFKEAAPNLMPTILSRAIAEARGLSHNMAAPADGRFVGIPYAEHLKICVVHDTPNTKLYLTASDVEEWGETEAQILETAFRNLTQLQNDFRSQFKDGRVFRSFADDTYDSARLLRPPSFFEQLPVRGTHVAMVPHPNGLLITGDQDPEGLHLVLTAARKFLGDPLAIGPYMFRISQSGWEPWTPEFAPADRREFEGLVLDTLERDYARQQGLLRAQQQKRPPDDQLFIASHMRFSKARPDGLRTLSVWTKNAPSLLPKTDAIAFVSGPKVQGVVPWSVVAAQMEDELEPTGTYPERYSALSFPTDEQLRSLIDEAVRRGVSQEP